VPVAVPVVTASDTRATEDKPVPPVITQPRSPTPGKRRSQARAVTSETTAPAKKAVNDPGETDAPSITKSVMDSEPEEIVISVDAAEGPIEKQARQLTAYERAENTFRQGVASLRKGRMAEAESRFREALAEDLSHAAARQALIGILIDSGRLADAQAVLADSLDANPRQPGLAMLLARLQVESGDLAAALQTLERTSTYAGSDADYRAFRAAVLQRAGRHDEAVEQYRNALVLAPGNAVWLMGLGISLRSLGENNLARQAFASAASARTLTPELQAFVEQQHREMERVLN
jgi:MSHA biogenesis protein MshN